MITTEKYEIGPPTEQGILRRLYLEKGFNLFNKYPQVIYFANGERYFMAPFSLWMPKEELAELDLSFKEMLKRA